jgi:hypothetical protein
MAVSSPLFLAPCCLFLFCSLRLFASLIRSACNVLAAFAPKSIMPNMPNMSTMRKTLSCANRSVNVLSVYADERERYAYDDPANYYQK